MAGLLLVAAKSRYVSEWPWHDFLRGQVVCRSIREVAEVTRIPEQTILTNLLHKERKTTLITKGPYNGIFQRRAQTGGEGFAIDVAVDLSTMLASGFIVPKVLSQKGEHLICLDVRTGTEWDTADRFRVKTHLACIDLGKDGLTETDTKEKAIIMLSMEVFRWNRVLGLFIGNVKFG